MSELSHLAPDGRVRMVDVGDKPSTKRVAIATGRFVTRPDVIALVRGDDLPKADVLATARIAGIAAAKRTPELIPLCHHVALSSVQVSFELDDTSILVEARAATTGPTGVEMEALTAVAVAGLTLHDMVKAVDPAARMTDMRLIEKTGGRSGSWTAPALGADPETITTAGEEISAADVDDVRRGVVLVASTAGAAGTRVDRTGPVLVDWLRSRGFVVADPVIVADADIAEGLRAALRGRPRLLVTTGGTGVSPTDATADATARILDRELPGIAESIRRYGERTTPFAVIGRGLAGLAGDTLVVNLPGSPGGVADGIAVLDPILDHLLAQISGDADHPVR
ncbi:bifunctional molybdenum cofactor biosynthesis protein MoaC/MoaB [Millisia brevis]|uniref:bifunctional molybdenum cofactor biosynthesis protein MoaC/MoaB n=1 Tax=Millisia brevis TaxID=264148 RepID=UPI00082C496E|nr:bifunctional molybdenum cofactor biosynthesis protein MoaC/MoaB [Millisia brevis]